MAATTYQCTICKRQREMLDSPRGVELTSICTITAGCRGSLIVVKRLPSTTRESTPAVVGELNDWEPRVVLHTHNQPIRGAKWRIIHSINVPVSVDVVAEGVEMAPDSYEVEFTTQNLITLTFTSAVAGVAQLLPRNGTKRRVYDAIDDDSLVQISVDGNIVLLDATSRLDAGTATVEVAITTPTGEVYTGAQTLTIDGLDRTSWNVRGVLANDITTHKVFLLSQLSLFTQQVIGPLPDGSRLEVELVQGRAPRRGEMLIGLTHSLSRTDGFNHNKGAAVDVSKLTSGIVFQRGEFFVYTNDIIELMPPLRIIP